jgi:NADPH2:quinone reductase
MRAAVCRAFGPPEQLEVEEVPVPVPGPGEVLVDIAAAAVNFPDILLVADQYQWHATVPFIPGSEFAGTVARLGEGVTERAVGDRVMGASLVGAYAERIVVAAGSLEPVAETVELTVAAAFGVAHRTAYHALRSVAKVEPGEWVVVLGAAGGVGLATVELAGVLGARVLAAASSPAKLERCRSKGAEALVDYTTEDLKVRIKEITGRGADVVIDPVGGPYAEQAIRSTRWDGRYVTVGFAAGEIPRIPLNLLLLKGVVLTGFSMQGFTAAHPAEERRDRGELNALLAAGRVAPVVSATYPLGSVPEALRAVADRRAEGKLLIDPHT